MRLTRQPGQDVRRGDRVRFRAGRGRGHAAWPRYDADPDLVVKELAQVRVETRDARGLPQLGEVWRPPAGEHQPEPTIVLTLGRDRSARAPSRQAERRFTLDQPDQRSFPGPDDPP